MFYVAYRFSKEKTQYVAKIYRAKAITPGRDGLGGPYHDNDQDDVIALGPLDILARTKQNGSETRSKDMAPPRSHSTRRTTCGTCSGLRICWPPRRIPQGLSSDFRKGPITP